MKTTLIAALVGVGWLWLSAPTAVQASMAEADYVPPVSGHKVMPTLRPNEYGTDRDNENNARTGRPDFDMDTAIYNTNSKHPIEFNINIPINPSRQTGVLVINVYDVDSSCPTKPCEVDEVFVNGTKVGVLTGSNNKWGYNRFSIPLGVLRKGKNFVQIRVDKLSKGRWLTNIDWAYITGLTRGNTGLTISRCWMAPVTVRVGDYVNFFAEVSGKPNKVTVFNGDMRVIHLRDTDGDNIYSGIWKVPSQYSSATERGWKTYWRFRALKSNGTVAWCPGINVVK